MSSSAANQIRQMVNFILQEAHEKANEIRIKTEHDFNLEKQMVVHNAKLRIQEEYAKKERDREVEDRIARSNSIGEARVTKMKERHTLLQSLLAQSKQQCQNIASNAGSYKQLMTGLLVQGMIKIDEENLELTCREADVQVVNSVKDAAVAQCVCRCCGCCCAAAAASDSPPSLPPSLTRYKQIMQGHGVTVNTVVTVGAKRLPNDSAGGIVLSADRGRIVCDNTLDARIDLVYKEQLPEIRATLFPVI